MSVKTLKSYMNLCREMGIEPTWAGLRFYWAEVRFDEALDFSEKK